jgi:hypothetical protein
MFLFSFFYFRLVLSSSATMLLKALFVETMPPSFTMVPSGDAGNPSLSQGRIHGGESKSRERSAFSARIFTGQKKDAGAGYSFRLPRFFI